MQNAIIDIDLSTFVDLNTEKKFNFIEKLILDKIDTDLKMDLYKNDSSLRKNKENFYEIVNENYDFSDISNADEIENFSYGIYESQNWIGHVEEVNSDSFSARLIDLTNGGTNEFANFDKKDISEDDQQLLKVGAAFYYSLGYSSDKGQVSKKAILRFQRLIEKSQYNIDNSLDRLIELKESINWE